MLALPVLALLLHSQKGVLCVNTEPILFSHESWLQNMIIHFKMKLYSYCNGFHIVRFWCHWRCTAQCWCTHFCWHWNEELSSKIMVCFYNTLYINMMYIMCIQHTKTFTQTAQNSICPVAPVKNASVSIFSTTLQSTVCPVHSGEIWATVNHYSSGHICQMNVWECWTVCFSPLMNWGI